MTKIFLQEDLTARYLLQKKAALFLKIIMAILIFSKRFPYSEKRFSSGISFKNIYSDGGLKLAEMGKLTLNDDVKKYFPHFPYDNVTIKLLLSHRSGLPNYIYFMENLGWDTEQYCTNEDVLAYLDKI